MTRRRKSTALQVTFARISSWIPATCKTTWILHWLWIQLWVVDMFLTIFDLILTLTFELSPQNITSWSLSETYRTFKFGEISPSDLWRYRVQNFRDARMREPEEKHYKNTMLLSSSVRTNHTRRVQQHPSIEQITRVISIYISSITDSLQSQRSVACHRLLKTAYWTL